MRLGKARDKGIQQALIYYNLTARVFKKRMVTEEGDEGPSAYRGATPPPMALVPPAGDVALRAVGLVAAPVAPLRRKTRNKGIKALAANHGVAHTERMTRRGRRAFVMAHAVANLWWTLDVVLALQQRTLVVDLLNDNSRSTFAPVPDAIFPPRPVAVFFDAFNLTPILGR